MSNIIDAASAKAEYIREEIHAEFHRFESGTTIFTPQALVVFENKWLKECVVLEQQLLAATLSPLSQRIIEDVEDIIEQTKQYIAHYVALLAIRYQATGELPVADSETEKDRKKRERKERMARYQRGEKPQ